MILMIYLSSGFLLKLSVLSEDIEVEDVPNFVFLVVGDALWQHSKKLGSHDFPKDNLLNAQFWPSEPIRIPKKFIIRYNLMIWHCSSYW